MKNGKSPNGHITCMFTQNIFIRAQKIRYIIYLHCSKKWNMIIKNNSNKTKQLAAPVCFAFINLNNMTFLQRKMYAHVYQ